MHQAFDTIFNFYKTTIIGDIGNMSKQARTHRVTTCQIAPWIVTQLFQTQRNTITFAVKTQYPHVQFVTYIDYFAGVADTFPGHVSNMQQTIDTAKINKRAIVGEVLDHAFDNGTFFYVFEQLLTFCAEFEFNNRTTGNHDIIALTVQFDDFEVQILTFKVSGIANRAYIHQ